MGNSIYIRRHAGVSVWVLWEHARHILDMMDHCPRKYYQESRLIMKKMHLYTQLVHIWVSANQFCCFKVFNIATVTKVAFSPTTLFLPPPPVLLEVGINTSGKEKE